MLLYSSSHHRHVSGWSVVICENVELLILKPPYGSLRLALHVHQCFSCLNCLNQFSVVDCPLRSVSVYFLIVTISHDFHRSLQSSGATDWHCPVYCFMFKTSFCPLVCSLVCACIQLIVGLCNSLAATFLMALVMEF